MANTQGCSVCAKAAERNVTLDDSKTKTFWADYLGVSEASVRRHFNHLRKEGKDVRTATSMTLGQQKGTESVEESSDGSKVVVERLDRKVTLQDARDWILSSGDDPDDYRYSVRSVAYGNGLWSNKMSAWPKAKAVVADSESTSAAKVPSWPVITPAASLNVSVPVFPAAPLVGLWKTAVATADHQVGFRREATFHDDRAIRIASHIIGIEQPDQVIYCGDFLDLPTLGKYEQEAAFADTLQRSIDRGHEILAIDRALAPNAEQVLIEGNHDRRMEKFVALNAMAAFGLKRANAPESWPVMSIPYLLRLDELHTKYIDAYPAGNWWINDKLRAIHGDKVRSGGSTASAYTNQLPHISTIFGHTHRTEVQSKTVLGSRGEAILTRSINPGCMCKVDGEVPSVKGSTGVDGKAARVVEDWQQGLAVVRYKDSGDFFVNLVQIDNGVTVYNNQELRA